MEKFYLKFCFVICIILLSACGTQTIRKDPQYLQDLDKAQRYYLDKDYQNSAIAYKQLYDKYQDNSFALYVADSWLQLDDYEKAKNYLSLVKDQSLALYQIIQVELNIENSIYYYINDTITGELRPRFLASKALIDHYNQDYLSAALSYIELSTYDEYVDFSNDIMNNLLQISESDLLLTLDDYDLSELQQGWFEAASIALFPDDLAISQWKNRWSDHPALIFFDQLSTYKKIAVLLPLSGRYKMVSKNIQEGMIAALYHNNSSQELVFFDTGSQGESFSYAWYGAIESGAELVIGPLEKKSIQQLTQINSSATPVFLLNQLEMEDNPFGFYQFSLSQDDEVNSVAKRLIAEDKKRIMLLAPESESARKLARAFEEEYNYLGGQIVSYDFYSESTHDYSREIKQALGLNDSQLRARKLQSILSEKITNTPQIRPDIDAIFIMAKPEQARLIKPQLKFFQASNVPVYSTSQIQSSRSTPTLDKDLDGIKFSQSNFIINPTSLQNDLRFDASEISNRKYFAFGFDALSISTRLEWMQRMQNQSLQGLTGNLSVDGNGKVHRDLDWAQFKRGVAVIIPPVVQTEDSSNDGLPTQVINE
jgi:outer membrane PBP1 activator LpoA protein